MINQTLNLYISNDDDMGETIDSEPRTTITGVAPYHGAFVFMRLQKMPDPRSLL